METTATKDLYNWSTNYNYPSPFTVFMDLTGFSHREFGQNLVSEYNDILGYLELDYLADALKEYANYPEDVYRVIEELIAEEYAEQEK